MASVAIASPPVARIREQPRRFGWPQALALLRPLALVAVLLVGWDVAISMQANPMLPRPLAVVAALWELASSGLMLKHVVASLFRVTWGFGAAAVLAIPAGLALGWYRSGGLAVNPLIQVLRPISPLAWIPIAILWLGVGDLAAIFLIFLASLFPLAVAGMNAIASIPEVYVQVARNFRLRPAELVYRVLIPAVAPQVVMGLRITLGVAWLVVVAAEMIAVNSGLGFLIVDARNAGNRYDLVVAGMVMIGALGLLLDTCLRLLDRLPAVSWGYADD